MSEKFVIRTNRGHALRLFFHSQLFRPPPYPTCSFANQTIIVTGANAGLGFEAARHFYRLNCAKLILAVRTVHKGQTAKEDIVRSVKHRSDGAEAIEVWQLDLTSTESTLSFADRAKSELSRVDVVIENAGVNFQSWCVAEGFEQVIQVNVINTLLLALCLLPKLAETKNKFPESNPHLGVVTSEAHRFAGFPEANAPDIYKELNDRAVYNANDRYYVSKLLEVLFIRELVSRLGADKTSPGVIVTLINPGLCVSSLDRGLNLVLRWIGFIVRRIIGRSTEVGSRTLVWGGCAGPGSHGEFMSDGENQDVEQWIYSDMGKRLQKKVFEQTMRVLEGRRFKAAKGDWELQLGNY